MISIDAYRNDPCGSYSIPYWKMKQMALPEGVVIRHGIPGEEVTGDCYFRLRHDLRIPAESRDGRIVTAEDRDLERLVSIINASYPNIRVSREQLAAERKLRVFRPELWVMAVENGGELGSGIAAFDEETGEVSLEWIQVLPEHRGRGIGKAIVTELLRRAGALGDFATVSGTGAETEAFYRSCGFTGADRWFVSQKTP